MARRTQVFQQLPWNGGVNTAVDSGLIPNTDLQLAQNILFSSNGAKIKREGHDYFDASSDVPAVSSGSSSGTTRTIIFASALQTGTIDKLVPGELISVSSSTSQAAYTETSVAVATINSATITYLSNTSSSSAATGTVTISRASPIVHIKDYWHFTGSTNVQSIIASTSQGLIFKYSDAGARLQILPNLAATGTMSNRASAGTLRTLDFTGAHGLSTGDYVRITSTVAAESAYTTISAQITATSGSQFTYVMPTSLTESVSSSTITVTKYSSTTPRVSNPNKQQSVVFNEALIIAQTGLGNTPIKYNPVSDADWTNLGGTPPDFSICALFLNRVWTNDKANPDRLHYSATGNAEKWQGSDDSGALDVRPGDGDSVGITGIYAFKGRIFVAKKNRMYQVVGDSPENFQVLDVSNGLGAEAQLSGVAVDQDDFMFVSSKGVHSLATTASYSDFSATYLSAKIQPTFNSFISSRLGYTQAVYMQNLSSIALSVSENDGNFADTIWFYNIQQKEWFSWPNMDAQALANVLLSSTPTLMFGTSDSRLVNTQNGEYTDYGVTAIRYRVKTGTIYPDSSPLSLKAFKRMTLFYRPVGSFSAEVKFKVDEGSEQSLNFTQVSNGDLLGSTFILGTSLLGKGGTFLPFTHPVDGYGHGCTIEIVQTGVDQQLAIYGYAIEYEAADMSQETITADTE